MKQWVAGLDLDHSKLFVFIFVKLQKKMKGFQQWILQEIMKKKYTEH